MSAEYGFPYTVVRSYWSMSLEAYRSGRVRLTSPHGAKWGEVNYTNLAWNLGIWSLVILCAAVAVEYLMRRRFKTT